MLIERVDLRHFRNYGELSFDPDPGVNIFFGQNGSGKTNFLEAIHYCSLGKSHRVSQDQNSVMIGQREASCALSVTGLHGRNEIEVRLCPGESAVKSVWINRKKAGRLSEMMGLLRCVIFSPEDLNLIKEGPSVRRKFLDMMISQISRPYFIALQKYRIAYNQRSAILRQARQERTAPDPMVQDFESGMAEQAELICREREKYVSLLSRAVEEIYGQISGRPAEILRISYAPSIRDRERLRDAFQALLEKSREDDMRRGTTESGPHRDDLNIQLNQQNMKVYASQGQIRSASLSLKLAQCGLFHQLTGEYPVLLLDDVMSELDLSRRNNLLSLLRGMQTFITCSDEGDLAGCGDFETFRVSAVEGQARIRRARGEISVRPVIFTEPDFS